MGSLAWLGTLAVLLCLAAGCSAAYPYLPGRSAAPPPGAAAEPGAPAPPEQAPPGPKYAAPPMEPQPDPARTIRDLELLVQQLEARVADLEAGKPLASSREAARRALKGYPAPTGAKAAGGGEKAYSEGMRLYQAKKYSEAREKFHQYLQGQPRGSKAPEARYHMADSFFQEGKYKEAGVEFNKLAVQFPKSILAPAALLRQAQAYKNLQQTANYRSILKKLEQTYPQSPEAREAQKWLKEK